MLVKLFLIFWYGIACGYFPTIATSQGRINLCRMWGVIIPLSVLIRLSHTLWRVNCHDKSTCVVDCGTSVMTLLYTDIFGTKIACLNCTPNHQNKHQQRYNPPGFRVCSNFSKIMHVVLNLKNSITIRCQTKIYNKLIMICSERQKKC